MPKTQKKKSKTLKKNIKYNSESTLFVFYNLLKNEYWSYNKLPNTWWWVGSGMTGKKDYPREEQFNGNKKNQRKLKEYLTNFFKKLKEKKIVGKFKIRNSYLP